MRVSFKYSQEDIVDATVRFSRRSRAIQRVRRRHTFWSAVGLASLAILILKASVLGIIVGAVAALIVIIINPYLSDRRYRKTLREFYKEKLGVEDEFMCEVDLLPDGLNTGGHDCWSTTKWSDIEDIVLTSDSVDIFGRKGGGCIVRNRAFNSAEERQKFIELAREYMTRSRAVSLESK
jgi:hypothetical protein